MTQRLPLYLSASLLAHVAVLLVWNAGAVPPRPSAAHDLQVSLIQTARQISSTLANTVQRVDTPSAQRNSAPIRKPAMVRNTPEPRHTTAEKNLPTMISTPAASTITSTAPIPRTHDASLSADLSAHLRSELRIAFKSYFSYPTLAQRHGWEGVVQLSLRLEADGRLSEVRLVRSSGHSALDADALATAQRIPPLREAVTWLQGNSQVIQLPVEYRLIDG